MKFLGVSWNTKRLAFLLVVTVVVGFALVGWEPSPWQGEVRVFRSKFHRAKIPYEPGMRVKDAIARSRTVLGEAAGESVVLYRWKPWLPERIPDATVMGLQGALGMAGLHGYSRALWQWWDRIVPRHDPWREIARDNGVGERLLESGEMVVLHTGP